MNNQIGESFASLNDQLSKLTRARAYQGAAAGRSAHDAAAGVGGGGRSGKRHGQGQGGESTSEEDELARHYAALGGNSPAIAGRDFPSAASIEYAAGTGGGGAPSAPREPDAERALSDKNEALGGGTPETTQLTPDDESSFQSWAATHNVHDVDHPDSHYDYRGYWKERGASEDRRGGADHFPDTYKQHGHPTFSRESKYSRGPGDGGVWVGDKFVAPPSYPTANYPTPKAPDTDALDAAYRAPGSYSYEYKDPSAQGAAPGRQAGPMAQELTGIPGVVHQGADGMQRVDTGRLTLANTSQTAKHRRELDDLKERLRALEGDPDAVLAAAAGGRAR